MLTFAVVAFDLSDAGVGDYDTAHNVLSRFGLSRTVGPSSVPLPMTTVLGPWPQNATVDSLRQAIWVALQKAGLSPARIVVVFASDWSANATQ